MDWTRAIDSYCERLGPGLSAEPLNALSNLAFLIAAYVMWQRVRGQQMPVAEALCAVLALIGLMSALFHSYAVVWTAIADSVSILIYVLLYLFAANRDYLDLRFWPALGMTLLFFPFAGALVPVFQMVPGLGGSAAYAPVPLLIALYALYLRRSHPETAAGLAIGAGILVISLGFRTIDEPFCAAFPIGTHFMWHILNGIMLGWMIEVYRRHRSQAVF